MRDVSWAGQKITLWQMTTMTHKVEGCGDFGLSFISIIVHQFLTFPPLFYSFTYIDWL